MQIEGESEKSLYKWNESSTALQTLNTQIPLVHELSDPLTYYKGGADLSIAYISDIHLRHHKEEVYIIAKELYNSKGGADIILFNGDTDDNISSCLELYKAFMRFFDYKNYLKFKEKSRYETKVKHAFESGFLEKIECRKSRIDKYIERLVFRISRDIDLKVFFAYKNKYYPFLSNTDAFSHFIDTKTFQKLNVSEPVIAMIDKLFSMYILQTNYERKIDRWNQIKTESNREVCSILDYQHHRLENVFVILGNHELLEYAPLVGDAINDVVSLIKFPIEELGIKVLHNEYVELERYGHKYILYGGTGFAKYEPVYNANRIATPCSREQEIIETEKFECNYNKALKYAKDNGAVFICASHYPVTSCLPHCDREAVYFAGHNHRNEYRYDEELVMYADNQVGYISNDFTFKHALIGSNTNPYKDLEDGLYKTTIKKYLAFYRYIGEDIGKGTLLHQRCQDGKAELFVVKHKGYYGFFIVRKEGNYKGISIVSGGITKKISGTTDLSWVCKNFDIVLSKYIELLLPLRRTQESLSKELKAAGFNGRIHGTIVDIDFYHHIMVNPLDGNIRVYYSPVPGMVKFLNSEQELQNSIEDISGRQLRLEYNKHFMEAQHSLTTTESLHPVSMSSGAYGVSRKVNQLQRIFSGHVLRDFDLRLIESYSEK